jgi:hypothetical protein
MCFQLDNYAHHQELFQTAVASTGFRLNAEVDVFPVGNTSTSAFIREPVGCDCSLKELLMMGKMVPETC